jgi:RNA polymerase sigma-70 factor (ECF subfamily)
MKDNRSLVQALKSNDRLTMERAFESLYNKYSGLLLYLSMQIVKRRDIAEEIVNDTFLKFFNNIERIDYNRNIKYWLSRTVKNASMDYLKVLNNQVTLSNEFVMSYPDLNHESNFQDIIRRFKSFLNEDELDIVVLHIVFKCTFKEIALEKNVSINVVSSKYKRTVEKIKKHYREVL